MSLLWFFHTELGPTILAEVGYQSPPSTNAESKDSKRKEEQCSVSCRGEHRSRTPLKGCQGSALLASNKPPTAQERLLCNCLLVIMFLWCTHMHINH